MAIVSTNRASYPSVNPNLRIGQKRKPKPKRIASALETEQINKAIVLLNDAKLSTNEQQFLYKVSEAFKIARDLWRGRNDV